MATKRPHSAMDVVHPSRQGQVPGSSRPLKKPRKMKPPIRKIQANSSSVNAIKKRIRDVKRRLERSENLPATVRVEDERALAAYEQELAVADEERLRQKMIKKYHMVRFFERQKATRQLKKLRRRLLEAKSEEEITDLKAKMHVAEVDLNYAQYYPLHLRYISLYPQRDVEVNEKGNQDEQINSIAEKPPMWTEVEKRTVDGTLHQLRNSSSAATISQEKNRNSKSSSMKSKLESTQRKENIQINSYAKRNTKDSKRESSAWEGASGGQKLNPNEWPASHGKKNAKDDDGSDGGFFEE